jgi:ribosome modulation factor
MAVVPHRDGTRTEHGFVSMTPWATGEMALFWLDGGRTEAASGNGHASSAAAMSLVHATLDGKGRLGHETTLDERVCDCCQTDDPTTRSCWRGGTRPSRLESEPRC